MNHEALRYLEEPWLDHLEARTRAKLKERQTWRTPLEVALYRDQHYVPRAHLRYISDRLAKALDDVENLKKDRFVVISLPPRVGKSTIASINFPLLVLHRHPDWPVMLLSHSPELATGWGRAVRRAVEEHPEFGVSVANDAGAVTHWETTQGGALISRSLRQSVTGLGARVLIVDDPVKDFADAHSEASREYVWDWWTANSRTRLHPPSLVVVIGTRWHEDDFIGRLQDPDREGDPEEWEVISCPAIADHDPLLGVDVLGREVGEPLLSPLIPGETTEEALTRWASIERSVGSYAWAGLFQQEPSPAKGAIFEDDWWRYWRPGELPERWDRVLTSWDCSFKNLDSSDFVVGQLWGVSGARRFLLAQVRKRMSFTETLAAIPDFISAARDYVPEGVWEHLVEDKANGTAVIDVLTTKIPGMIPINPTESKEARARAATPDCESGNVILPAEAPWLAAYVSEFHMFPNGRNDDQVDCSVQALHRLRDQGATVVLLPVATVSRGYQRTGTRTR